MLNILNNSPYAPAKPGVVIVRDVSCEVQLLVVATKNMSETSRRLTAEIRLANASADSISEYLHKTGWGLNRALAIELAGGMVSFDFLETKTSTDASTVKQVIDNMSLSASMSGRFKIVMGPVAGFLRHKEGGLYDIFDRQFEAIAAGDEAYTYNELLDLINEARELTHAKWSGPAKICSATKLLERYWIPEGKVVQI